MWIGKQLLTEKNNLGRERETQRWDPRGSGSMRLHKSCINVCVFPRADTETRPWILGVYWRVDFRIHNRGRNKERSKSKKSSVNELVMGVGNKPQQILYPCDGPCWGQGLRITPTESQGSQDGWGIYGRHPHSLRVAPDGCQHWASRPGKSKIPHVERERFIIYLLWEALRSWWLARICLQLQATQMGKGEIV